VDFSSSHALVAPAARPCVRGAANNGLPATLQANQFPPALLAPRLLLLLLAALLEGRPSRLDPKHLHFHRLLTLEGSAEEAQSRGSSGRGSWTLAVCRLPGEWRPFACLFRQQAGPLQGHCLGILGSKQCSVCGAFSGQNGDAHKLRVAPQADQWRPNASLGGFN